MFLRRLMQSRIRRQLENASVNGKRFKVTENMTKLTIMRYGDIFSWSNSSEGSVISVWK